MVQFKLASTLEERIAALRLVYHAYVKAGLIKPNKYHLRLTPFHMLPTTRIALAIEDGQIVHTMSVIEDSHLGLPMEVIYHDEVERFRNRRLRIAEISCLAGHKISPQVMMGLSRFVFWYGVYAGIDTYLIAVHPTHASFYKRVQGFRQFGAYKLYPSVGNNPAVALELDLHDAEVRFPARTRLFAAARPFKPSDYAVRDPSPEELAYLAQFVDETWQLVAASPLGPCEAEESLHAGKSLAIA